jgi:hypothetical protein
MKGFFRTWFTPGSVVAAATVALLWLHRLHLSLAGRETAQLALISVAFLGLFILSNEQLPGG